MDDYALILNAGSSSLKFCVFRRPVAELWQMDARGQIESIGTSPRFLAKDADGKIVAENDLSAVVRDAPSAIDAIASWLRSKYGRARVLGVGHRVVHGGTLYAQPTIVTPKVLADLHELVPLAPLHQPHNLAAIQAVFERMPHVPQVACFDTGFHQGHSAITGIIPFPTGICKSGLTRYGFHGLSYEYVNSMLLEIAPEIAKGRIIIAHLGSGASLCAIRDGKSVDTTMSFTALDGLCMGTRPGSIDPGAVLYLFQTLGMTVKEVETILYKKSGLLGISGISSDMRELLSSNAPEACLAVDYFVYRITKEIGALTAILGGIDALVFTAGIGENSPEIRRRICESSSWLGVELDASANSGGGARLSTPASKVSVFVVPTNEELMIARHTGALLRLVEPIFTS
jgi:acetate kinase